MGTLGLRDGSKYQLVIATICVSFHTIVYICLIFYFLFNFLGHSIESQLSNHLFAVQLHSPFREPKASERTPRGHASKEFHQANNASAGEPSLIVLLQHLQPTGILCGGCNGYCNLVVTFQLVVITVLSNFLLTLDDNHQLLWKVERGCYCRPPRQ